MRKKVFLQPNSTQLKAQPTNFGLDWVGLVGYIDPEKFLNTSTRIWLQKCLLFAASRFRTFKGTISNMEFSLIEKLLAYLATFILCFVFVLFCFFFFCVFKSKTYSRNVLKIVPLFIYYYFK